MLTVKSGQGVIHGDRRTRHGCAELKVVNQDTGRVSVLWTTGEVRTPDVLILSPVPLPA
jgi:hypothetical protein